MRAATQRRSRACKGCRVDCNNQIDSVLRAIRGDRWVGKARPGTYPRVALRPHWPTEARHESPRQIATLAIASTVAVHYPKLAANTRRKLPPMILSISCCAKLRRFSSAAMLCTPEGLRIHSDQPSCGAIFICSAGALSRDQRAKRHHVRTDFG